MTSLNFCISGTTNLIFTNNIIYIYTNRPTIYQNNFHFLKFKSPLSKNRYNEKQQNFQIFLMSGEKLGACIKKSEIYKSYRMFLHITFYTNKEDSLK